MRKLTEHKLEGLNEALDIFVLDEPGHGGACHDYMIEALGATPDSPFYRSYINFQNGPVKEHGVNGVSQESLLAIVIDRLACFQAGDYASPDNAVALEHCRKALEALQRRTKERLARGVEGTSVK